MPITRSELVYFAAGVAVGATARSAFPIFKQKIGPVFAGVIASAGAAFSDAYAEAVRRVADNVESVQDAVVELKRNADNNGTSEQAA